MLRNILKKSNLIYILYLIFSLILLFALTKYLLPDGYIIAGHDSGLALDSAAFLETRLYAWDERINFGHDNSLLFGSLTLHAIDYLFSLLSGTSYAGNQLNLFFWVSLIFISAFIFAYQLKDKLGENIVYIFPVIVLFNFYLFQSLFILERAKYSLVAASLLFLAINVRLLKNKISALTGAIIASLIFSILNGGSWLGLPLFGGLVLIGCILAAALIITALKERSFNTLLKFLLFLVLTGFFFILLNSYSLFPYVQTFLKNDYSIIQDSLVHDANRAWLDYISQGSSFLNIFRMQGVPDWYLTKYTPQSMHPFASIYMQQPLFIALSFLIPVGAFASLLLAKTRPQKRIIILTAVISLVSMIFMAGTRSPLGFFYEFLFNHIPGFVIFRSSFYKFGYAFIISYALLISFTTGALIDYLSKKKILFFNPKSIRVVLVLSVILLWFFYHQYLTGTNIFDWRTGSSTRIKVPSYVDEYKEYVKNQNITQGRTLILPKFHEVWLSDGYNFGYWSLSTIHYSLTKQPVLANDASLTEGEKTWVNSLYTAIRAANTEQTQELAKRLGVNKFLIKKDSLMEKDWSGVESPDIYQKIIESFDFIEKEKEFGSWILYSLKNPGSQEVFLAKESLVEIKSSDISSVKPLIGSERLLVNNNATAKIPDSFINQKIDYFTCTSCFIEDPVLTYEFIWPRILPNSLVFKLKLLDEQKELKSITDRGDKLNFYLSLAAKRVAEIDAMLYYQIHDAYVIENLQTIDGYLSEVQKINQDIHNPDGDFEAAKNLIDKVHSIEEKISNRLHPSRSDIKSDFVKDEMTRILWKIAEIKKFYDPILGDISRWSSEKVFDVEVPQTAAYQIYIDEYSMPEEFKKNPGLLSVTINGQEQSYNQNPTKIDNLIPLPADNLKAGKNTVTLKFADSANLFINQGEVQIETPQGIRRCFLGIVNSQGAQKDFLLKIKTKKEGLRIFQESAADDFQKFSDWRKSIFVEGSYEDDYFRTQLKSASPNGIMKIYICGDYPTLPSFNEVIVSELYTPRLIGVENLGPKKESSPQISYNRIDPTRYQLNTKSTKPFVLIMNQRYSPLWAIKDRKTGRKIKSEPFPIDSYATAWLINSTGDLELSAEYEPQEYFYKGIIVTMVTLIVLSALLLSRGIKRG